MTKVSIATWNVNSIRARLPRLLPWLEERKPDIVCLQETKVVDELFPREPIEDLCYNIATFGQKTYNGVAILSKSPMEDISKGFPEDDETDQKRAIAVRTMGFHILDLYVVNGKEVGSDKYAYKLQWLERLLAYVRSEFDLENERVVLTGDFNITFDDLDVYDPKAWEGKILCSEKEREALKKLTDLGLVDAFRHFHGEEEGQYTWWDFRTRAFQRGNRGLRIDHFLLSKPAMEICTNVWIDREAREGEKPSDHAPVIAEFEV